MKCIYIIVSKIHDDRIYIGSTISFDKRKNTHVWELNKGSHHSYKLQRHFDKYGIEDLSFEIIDLLKETDDIVKAEQFYLDNLECFFNTIKIATNYKRPNIYRPAWNKGLTNLPKQSKSHVDSRVSKATIAKHKKVSQYDIYGNFINEFDSMKLAGELTGINEACISNSTRGTTKTAGKFIWRLS